MSRTDRDKRPRIGLDARAVFMPRPRGTGRNLLDAYQLIPALRPDWDFVLYHQRGTRGLAAGPKGRSRSHGEHALANLLSMPNVRARRIDMPGDRFDLWFQVRLPAAAWRDGVDLLHLPANVAPARCPVPFVATIHDLIPLTVEGQCLSRRRRAFRRGVERALHGATHLMSPSRATRDELRRVFDLGLERITVVPWAPDRGIVSALGDVANADSRRPGSTLRAEIERVRARYGLDQSWLLNFSGASARKNATGLIDAFAGVPLEVRGDTQLVLIGIEPAARRGELRTRSERLAVRANCRFLGFVPHEDLPGLLCGARGLVMPSLGEGFGLPILDAFACGTPVMTSNLSSMPEVAGDAAVYCDPHSVTSITAGIARLLEPATADRLTRAGFERLTRFRWERTANLICGVYEQCLGASRRRAVEGPIAAGALHGLNAKDSN